MRSRPVRGEAARRGGAGGPDFSANAPTRTPASTDRARESDHDASALPPAAPDATDPAAVWQAVLDGAASDAANRWLRDLRLIRLDGDQAHFAILPAARPRASYIKSKQPDLAQRLSAALGSSVRVRIDEDASHTADTGEAPPTRRGPDPGRGGRQRLTDAERDAAARLPLVSRIIEQFNAAIVDVRDEPPGAPGLSADDDEED